MITNIPKFNTPSFTGIKLSPALSNAKPFITRPKSKIFDKNLKIIGLASSALTLASIAINKKKELPSWDEYKKELSKMVNHYGQQRFSNFCLEEIEMAYKNNPVLTSKLINLKTKNKWFINFGTDIALIVDRYKNHPEFSDLVLKKTETESTNLISFLKAQSCNQQFLKRLFNYQDEYGNPLLNGVTSDLIINFYKENPIICEKILNTTNPDGKYSWVNCEIAELIDAYKKYPKKTLELMDFEKENGNKLETKDIKSLALMEKDDRNFFKGVLKSVDLAFFNAIDLYNTQIDKDFILEMIETKDFWGNRSINSVMIPTLRLCNQKQAELYREFFLLGIPYMQALSFAQNENAENIKILLELGIEIKDFEELLKDPEELKIFITDIKKNPGPMREFFNTPDFFEKIKQNSAGKYQKELINIFEKDKLPYIVKEQLIKSGLTIEEFLNSLKKISKSCFKLAYDTPNQYLSNINIKYSKLINGHYPKLPPEELDEERKEILKFFIENIGLISRILKYIDNDTFNHLMDKRTELFKTDLVTLNNLPNETLEILSNLLKCKSQKTNEKLSPKEKTQLCQIVSIFDNYGFDFKPLTDAIDKNKVNIRDFKKVIELEVFKTAGIEISQNGIENKKINENFAYLTLKPSIVSAIPESEKKEIIKQIHLQIESWREDEEILENEIIKLEKNLKNPKFIEMFSKNFQILNEQMLSMLKNIENYSDEELFDKQWEIFISATNQYSCEQELYTTIREAVLGDFKTYIKDKSNKYGKINALTKNEFKKRNLDYEKWISPSADSIKFNISGKDMQIKFWERNPLEDLFLGNKTTCCTAIGRTNGGSMAIYLLGTCWNVIELCDEKGNTVGMSRVFMGNVDEKPALIMDNIELNNNYIKTITSQDKTKIRNAFFKYIKTYAQDVTGKEDTKIYFCSKDVYVPVEDLEKIDKKVEFIGTNPTPKVYVNSANCSWINQHELKEKEYRWYVVP